MNLRQNRLASVLLATGVLVGAANVATYAGTGDALLLGRTNTSARPTVVVSTGGGPVLELEPKPGAAPLAVSSSVKVPKLNADKLDGLSARALQMRSIIYRIPPQGPVGVLTLELRGLDERVYQASFSVVALMSEEAAQISCYFFREGGSYDLLAYGTTHAGYSTSTASGLLDLRDGVGYFRCFASGGSGNIDPDSPAQSQIVLTPLDRLGIGEAVERPMRRRQHPSEP